MLHNGIKILTNSQPKSIEKTDNGLKIILEESEEIVLAEAIALAAIGRVPNIEDLGLDLAGVDIKNGAIAVNEQSQTSQPNIYAVGDCTNRINLTPVAIGEGRALADTIYGNKPRLMSHVDVPSAIFTHPEAATVGLSEQQAKQKYGPEDIKSYRAKFRPLYHTLSGEAEKTMMKLIVQISTDRVLGAHMVGEHASEIIQGVAIAIKMGATKADFDATVGIHPSAAEEFVTMR
jgi:glutathione reductase (NADPH)